MLQGWLICKNPKEWHIQKLLLAHKGFNLNLKIINSNKISFSARGDFYIKKTQIALPDFAIYRQTSKSNYSGTALARQLELLNIPVFNKFHCYEIADDKFYVHQLLEKHKIPTPLTYINSESPKEKMFPLIMKYNFGSLGLEVSLLQNSYSWNLFKRKFKDIITQEYIADSKGKDIRVFVIGGKAIFSVERKTNNPEEFRSNVRLGGDVRVVETNSKIQEIVEEIQKIFDCPPDFFGIDLLYYKDSYLVSEINTNFHWGPHGNITCKKTCKKLNELPFIIIKHILKELR